MLELSKKILQNVSFNQALFAKELSKALKWIKPNEKMLLKMWCLSTFGAQYREIIMQTFQNYTK